MRIDNWTKEEIETLKKLYPTVPTPDIAESMGRTRGAVRTKAIKLKIQKLIASNNPYTPEKKLILEKLYPNTTNKEIARILNVTESSVIAAGFRFKLKKTPEFMREHTFKSCYKKGRIPENKGKKITEYASKEAIEKIKATQFKKGGIPACYGRVGSERINSEGYIEVKVADPNKWKMKHVFEWEKLHGTVPNGYIVVFANKNKADFSPANLEIITRKENMERNTVHNYPKEIAVVVQLRGALNRQINKHKKKLYEK
jgi:hypothetical protein